MDADEYKTIAACSQGFYKEKGSKFLSFAYPINNEDEVKKILTTLKKKYHDARHYCYAFVINNNKYRMCDDGEPSNTAGKPILNQIQKNNLYHVLVVVIRYFGGTLLGTAGLANAYKAATADAISKAIIKTITITECYKLIFSHLELNTIINIIKKEKITILEKNIDLKSHLIISIQKSNVEYILSLIKKNCTVEIIKL